jgi:hypothetical protein
MAQARSGFAGIPGITITATTNVPSRANASDIIEEVCSNLEPAYPSGIAFVRFRLCSPFFFLLEHEAFIAHCFVGMRKPHLVPGAQTPASLF